MKRQLIIPGLIFLSLALAHPTSAQTSWYVATNGTGGGTSWADATNSLQGAIAASSAGDTVWVSNGVYETGGIKGYPSGTSLTNRVAIYKAITVRSANNDPTNTIIKGSGPNGAAAVRCVFMSNGSTLIGFTLTNGATLALTTDDGYGGGVYCQSTNTVISNCVLTRNLANYVGGGAFSGILYNCTLTGNSAQYGGGARYCTLNNCTIASNSASVYGGGTSHGTLSNCTLTGNSAPTGGGARSSLLYNCLLTGNSASSAQGGGAYASTMFNCLLSGNSAGSSGGGGDLCSLYNCTLSGNSAVGSGGGVNGGTLYNCISWGNDKVDVPGTFRYSCGAGYTNGGSGNITNDPLFITNGSGYGLSHVAGDYHLSIYSPALNAGTNFSWMTDPADARSKDLDDLRRIDNFSRQVDMGCYELMPSGTMFTFH